MNQKILFFDIDGTLLSADTHEIPVSTIQAVRQARDNGHLAFINTGRTRGNIGRRIQEIGFDGYVCGCGTYIEADGKVLLQKELNKETCAEIVIMLRKCRLDAVLEGSRDVYFDDQVQYLEEVKKMKQSFANRGLGIDKNWDSEGLVYDKLYTMGHEGSDIDSFISYIQREFDYIDRGRLCGECVPKGYSKGTGIDYLLKHYNLPLENAIVLGDSSNDIPMFQFAKNSVAMGNSEQCILDCASYITRDIHEDGIAHALKHYCIIA